MRIKAIKSISLLLTLVLIFSLAASAAVAENYDASPQGRTIDRSRGSDAEELQYSEPDTSVPETVQAPEPAYPAGTEGLGAKITAFDEDEGGGLDNAPVLSYSLTLKGGAGSDKVLTGDSFVFELIHSFSSINYDSISDFKYTIRIDATESDNLEFDLPDGFIAIWDANDKCYYIDVPIDDPLTSGGERSPLTFTVTTTNGYDELIDISASVELDCIGASLSGVDSETKEPIDKEVTGPEDLDAILTYFGPTGSVKPADPGDPEGYDRIECSATATYTGYDVTNTASSSAVVVAHEGNVGPEFDVGNVTLYVNVTSKQNNSDYGTILPGSIEVSNRIELPEGVYFGTGGSAMLGEIDLLTAAAGTTFTAGGVEWTIDTITVLRDASDNIIGVEYTLSADKGSDPYLDLSSAQFQIALSGLKTELAPEEFYDVDGKPTEKITSEVTVNSESVVSGVAQVEKNDDVSVTLVSNSSEVGGNENLYASNRVGKNIKSYTDSNGFTKDFGDGTDDIKDVIYDGGNNARVTFSFGGFGNYQDGEMESLTLTETAVTGQGFLPGEGYDPALMIPVSINPGTFTNDPDNEIKAYLVINGVKITPALTLGQDKDISSYVSANTSSVGIVYENLPAGAESLGDAGMTFKLNQAAILESGVALPQNIYNKVNLDYTYTYFDTLLEEDVTFTSPGASAQAQFIYHGKGGYAVGVNKEAVTKSGGYYAGDIIDYSLFVENVGTRELTGLIVTDYLEAEYIVDHNSRDCKIEIFAPGTTTNPVLTLTSYTAVVNPVDYNPLSETSGDYYEMVLDFANIVFAADQTHGDIVLTDAQGKLILPPGYTIKTTYQATIKDSAPDNAPISNQFIVTWHGDGGGLGGRTISGEIEIKTQPSVPVIGVRKTEATYASNSNASFESFTAGGTLTYTLYGTYYDMYGSETVTTLQMKEAIPAPLYANNATYPLKFKITGIRVLNGDGTSASAVDWGYAVACAYNGVSVSTNISTDYVSGQNYINFVLTRTDGTAEIPKGTTLEIEIEYSNFKITEDQLTNFESGSDTGYLAITNTVYCTVTNSQNKPFSRVIVASGSSANKGSGTNTTYPGLTTATGGTSIPSVYGTHRLDILKGNKAFVALSKSVVKVNGGDVGPILITDYNWPDKADTVTFTISVINRGDPETYHIYDLLPEGLEFVSMDSVTYRTTSGGGLTSSTNVAAGSISHTTEASSGRKRISFSYTLSAEREYLFTYTAKVTSKTYADANALKALSESLTFNNEVVLRVPTSHTPLTTEATDAQVQRILGSSPTASYHYLYASAPITYVLDEIRPGITKALTNGGAGGLLSVMNGTPAYPEWTLTIYNGSRVPMTDFYVADVLPVELEYVEMLAGGPDPVSIVPDFNANGDTLIVWHFTEQNLTKAATNGFTISFKTKTVDGIVSSSYTNFAYVIPADEFDHVAIKSGGTLGAETTIGSDEATGSGSFGDTDIGGKHAVRAEADVKVSVDGNIISYKSVADSNESAGSLGYVTLEDGETDITYTLTLENPGGAKSNIRILDVLPDLSDQGSYTSEYRSSKFPVTGVKGIAVAVNGVAVNPDLYEVYLSDQGKAARRAWNEASPVWADTIAPVEANAFLVVFVEDFTISDNAKLTVSFISTVDNSALAATGIAWNSFAYQFSKDGTRIITGEPPKVGVKVIVPGTEEQDDKNSLTIRKNVVNGYGSQSFFFRLFVLSSELENGDGEVGDIWIPYRGHDSYPNGVFSITTGSSGNVVFSDLPNGKYMAVEYPTLEDAEADTDGTGGGAPDRFSIKYSLNNVTTDDPAEVTLIEPSSTTITVTNTGGYTPPIESPSPSPSDSPSPSPSPSEDPSTPPSGDPSTPPSGDPSTPPSDSPTPSIPVVPPTPTPPAPTPTPPEPSEPVVVIPDPPNPPLIPDPPTPGDENVYYPPGSDGSVIVVINDEGTPLGQWTLGEDYVWIFDEEVPLANMPRTGDSINPVILGLLAAASLTGIGLLLVYPAVKRRRKA